MFKSCYQQKVQLLDFCTLCDLHVVYLVPWFCGGCVACELVVFLCRIESCVYNKFIAHHCMYAMLINMNFNNKIMCQHYSLSVIVIE